MSITVGEKPGGVTYENGRLTVVHIVGDAADEATARAAVEAYAVPTRNGLGRQTPVCTEMEAAGYWEVSVEYVSAEIEATDFIDPPATGDKQLSIDLTVGTVRMYKSLSTDAAYDANPLVEAPDFKGAINVHKSGGELTVDGVDLPGGGCRISAIEYIASPSGSYMRACMALRLKTNAEPFTFTPDGGPSITYAAGELLYLGPVFSKRGSTDWEASHQFLFNENETDIVITDTITVLSKLGWQYLWIYYEDDVDDDTLVKVPRAVYVENVFSEGNFSVL